jgi:hypothetical protein
MTIFGDFHQFSAEKIAAFLKNVSIAFFNQFILSANVLALQIAFV